MKGSAVDVDLHGIAGEFGIGSGEIDAGGPAHGAAATIAIDEPLCCERLVPLVEKAGILRAAKPKIQDFARSSAR